MHWNQERIHKTKVVNNNLDPDWTDETVVVSVSPYDASGELVVSVWDSDGPLVKGDFLGQATVLAETLLSPPQEPLTLELGPKEGLSTKQLKLVQGTLTLSFPNAGGQAQET